jgi:Carboxypeptidase regulatory-like domain
MMRRRAKLLFVLLSIVVLTSVVFAVDKGTLLLRVVDDQGAALAGVSITITSPVMMGSRAAVTDERGEALFVNLGPGLYEAKVTLPGFQQKTSTGIQISIDKKTEIQVELKPATLEESVVVVATTPTVDTSKSVIAEYVTHQVVESLPVARDFVGYLQLAAGVNMVPNSQGADTPEDPAGKGGLNYQDRGLQGIGGGVPKRGSRDNDYYIDGMNITNLNTQRAGMTFNNEVIQEEELLTSGIPAEYGGGKGVVGNIVTKSGGNTLSGSLNIYGQPRSFFLPYGGEAYNGSANPSMLEGYKDNKYDTAATLGGPVIKDALWFFISGQYRKNSSKFNLSESASSVREQVDYTEDRTGVFGKATLKLSPNDSLSVLSFLDTFKQVGSRDVNTVKDWQYKTDYNMGVVSGFYQRVLSQNFILDARYGFYWRNTLQNPRYSDAGTPDRLYYIPGQAPPIEDQYFGGGPNVIDTRSKRHQLNVNAEWFLGNMRLKGGLSYAYETDQTNPSFYWGESRSSLDPALAGRPLGELVNLGVWTRSEFQTRLLNWMNRHWDATADYYDLNHDGRVTIAELGTATFTVANAAGLNFLRTYDGTRGKNNVKALRWVGYLMDDWEINKYLTLNAGIRIEDHDYRTSRDTTILHMKPKFLPRVGLSWNIGGAGTHKLSLFYGQFSDPIPFNMIHFAGNISGRVQEEQIWLNGGWYTYRLRGSAEVLDCVWTPNTKDGLSQEVSLSHQIDLGGNFVLSSQVYYRGDRNIIEDYDLGLYIGALPNDPIWSQYALTYEDFGYPATGPGDANYFLSNLIGGKRDYYGFDFELSKRFGSGSAFVAQYSYKDARGNSQSDGNADIQGDMVELDPRTPWMMGPTPGSIAHRVKVYGTYRTPFGLDIGALFYWNSGLVFTESLTFYPGTYNIYYNNALNEAQTEFVKTGQQRAPGWYQIDLKFNYALKLVGRSSLQLFLDIYNLTNNQAAIDVQYSHNDQVWNYKEITEILLPMRVYAGARIRF